VSLREREKHLHQDIFAEIVVLLPKYFFRCFAAANAAADLCRDHGLGSSEKEGTELKVAERKVGL